MAKKRKPKKKPQTPKGIFIEDDDTMLRMYKIWNGDKKSDTPFFATDSLDDLMEKYELCIKEWHIKPDIKLIKNLINKYSKNRENGESDI